MRKILLGTVILLSLVSQNASAQFPADFSDVVWLDTDVSGWAETARLNVSADGTFVYLPYDKATVWPARGNQILGLDNPCCNANVWVFAQFDGVWYAVTWEWLGFGQQAKFRSAFEGAHTKRAPFFGPGIPTWQPVNGQVYGLMVSGFARFKIPANIEERSNVAFIRWGQGQIDVSELLPEPEKKVNMSPIINFLLGEDEKEFPLSPILYLLLSD